MNYQLARSSFVRLFSLLALLLFLFVVSAPAEATSGSWTIIEDTTLTEDHFGGIVIGADGVTLDCASRSVRGPDAYLEEFGILLNSRTDVTVKNCHVSGFNRGIQLYSSTGNTIEDNDSSQNAFVGMELHSSTGNSVSGNSFYDNGNYGLLFFGSADSNLAVGNKAEGNTKIGIVVNTSSNNTVSENIVRDNGHDGINVYQAPGTRVLGNAVSGNGFGVEWGGSGISTSESPGSEFGNNESGDNAGDGLRADHSDDVIWSGNAATGNGRDGLIILFSTRATVIENEARENGRGITLGWSHDNDLQRNIAASNVVDGFHANTANHNSYTDNLAKHNGASGISFYQCANNWLSGNTLQENIQNGISLYESSNNILSGNTADQNTEFGISLGGSSYNNQLLGNSANSNGFDGEWGAGGFVVRGSDGNTFQDNVANDNAQDGFNMGEMSRNAMIGNQANSNGRIGIALWTDSNDNIVTGNIANGNGYLGMIVYAGSDNALEDNTANGNAQIGIALNTASGNTLTSNTTGQNGTTGIDLYRSSNNTFSGNISHHNYENGFGLGDSHDNQFLNNTATRNGLDGKWGGGGFGAWGSTGNLFEGNLVEDNAYDGFNFSSSTNNWVISNQANNNGRSGIGLYSGTNSNEIIGNTANGNGYGSDWGSGIAMYEAESNLFESNLANDNAYEGIHFNRSPDNVIRGNTVDGNGARGIAFFGESHRNIITANTVTQNAGTGIFLSESDWNIVQSNYVGTDESSADLGNGSSGIGLDRSRNNLVGGLLPGEGNTIAYSRWEGVGIGGDETHINNRILGNSIYNNNWRGIHMWINPDPPDVTSERWPQTGVDALDADTGPNGFQNYPEITSTTILAGTVSMATIEGSLHSTPNTEFRIEFFANAAGAPAHRGEGETFLGAADVMTDAEGNAFFSIDFPMEQDYCVTATATGPEGTSPFTPVMVGPVDNGNSGRSHCVTGMVW